MSDPTTAAKLAGLLEALAPDSEDYDDRYGDFILGLEWKRVSAIIRFLRAGAQQQEALIKLHQVFDFEQRLDPNDFDIEDTDFANVAFGEAYTALNAWREAETTT